MSPVFAERSQRDFVLHPAGGPFPAVVSEVRLHEGVQTQYGIKDRIQITFQTNLLAREHVDEVEDDRPMTISLFVNRTLNDKGRLLELICQQVEKDVLLRRIQESGEPLDIEEQLVGTQWLIQVQHDENGDKTYANISSSMKAPPDQKLEIWREGDCPI